MPRTDRLVFYSRHDFPRTDRLVFYSRHDLRRFIRLGKRSWGMDIDRLLQHFGAEWAVDPEFARPGWIFLDSPRKPKWIQFSTTGASVVVR